MLSFLWLLKKEPLPGAHQAVPCGYATNPAQAFISRLVFRSVLFYLVPAITGTLRSRLPSAAAVSVSQQQAVADVNTGTFCSFKY